MSETVKIKQFKNRLGEPVAGLSPAHAVYLSKTDETGKNVRLDAALGNVDLSEFQRAQTEGITAIQAKKVEGVAAVEAKKEEILALSDASLVTYDNTDSGLEAENVKDAIDEVNEINASIEDLTNGNVIPALAKDLKSWSERDAVLVYDEWDAIPVRTTAGSLSVNTSEGSHLISVKSKGEFSASGFSASGFNLIKSNQLVGGVPYVLVPACTFGTFGTADENNGLLVTDNTNTNKKVAMRFKSFASGIPTNVNDGQACPYQDVNGYRFFLPPTAGYVWASDMPTTYCLHIAWSKDYDKYEAIATPSSISFSTILNKFSSVGGVYKMLYVQKGGIEYADTFIYENNKFTWTKYNSYNNGSSWVNTSIGEEGETKYKHELTLTDIATNGIAIDMAGLIELNVTDKTVWYEDEYSTSDVDIKYQLETPTTGTVTLANTYQPNDMGCEYIESINGDANIVTTYYQDLQDELAALPSKVDSLNEKLNYQIECLKQSNTGIAEMLDNIITGKMMIAINTIKDYYRGLPKRTYGIGYYTITPTFGTPATITFNYKVNAYSFAFDVNLTAEDTIFTFKSKFKASLTTAMSYLGVKPIVELLDNGTGIQFNLDTDTEIEINTVTCTGATLTEVSDHPTTAPMFIGQLYHNSQKKKEWEAKSVLTANDWVEKY